MGTIVEGKAWEPEDIISSGSLLLDYYLKFGGYPVGSIVQYYSPPKNEGSFKTTLGLLGLVEFQKKGHKVGGIDVELTPWDLNWLEAKGLTINDKKKWVMGRPVSGEESIEYLDICIRDKECKAVLFDSVDYARPQKYHESKPGDANMGDHAKLMRQFWQHCKDLSETHQASIFVINQSADIMGTSIYDKGENLSGGKGAYYAPTISIRMRRPTDSKLFDVDLIPIKVQIKRSKMGSSWKKFTTYFLQEQGVIDRYSELLLLGQLAGIMVPSNKQTLKNWRAWYKIKNPETEKKIYKKIGNDFVEARNWVFDNEEKVIKKLLSIDTFKKIRGLHEPTD